MDEWIGVQVSEWVDEQVRERVDEQVGEWVGERECMGSHVGDKNVGEMKGNRWIDGRLISLTSFHTSANEF